MSFVGDFNSAGFESWSVDLTSTDLTTVLTVDSDSKRYLVKSVIFCNHGPTSAIDVSLQWYDDSNSLATWLVKNHSVVAETQFEALGTAAGPIVLSGSDIVKVQADAANLIHVTVTAMLLSRETGQQ